MDGAGRIASVTDPYGKTVGYEWGSMGERTAVRYPDGRKAAYEYNGAMQLTAMKVFSGEKQEQTVRYSYDEAGRLAGKQFPGGSTEYRYSQAGRIGEILHKGADFTERLRYAYDVMGNKVTAEKDRPESPEDSGIFSYGYDELNRLTGVAQNGKILRSYSYDAFGNRSSKTEYQTAGELTTTYHYNTKNQLVQEKTANGIKDYAYDRRGNLLSVTSGGEVLRVYEFDAVNQMSSSMGEYGGIVKKAEYQYNGLGHRMNQKIWKYEQIQPENPEHQIRYTLDLTRQYNNLLQKEDSYTETVTDKTPESGIQSFYWDRNVVSMEADGIQDFYLQDDLGSPVNLVNQDGQSIERYAYDEFGMPCVYRENKVSGLFVGSAQPFGFNGYQMDEAGGLYFAQARRYDAGAGRFISEDFIKGHIAVPYTMNHYSYCFNRPMDLVDLNGMWPTAVVTSDLAGMDTKSEELDESDPVHIASDWYTNIGNMKDIKEGGEISYQWLNQYKKNKNLAKSIIDNPTTKINAAEAGVGVGNFRRTTRGKIKNGLAEMENIGNTAKVASKFEVPYVDVIIDVGVGIYDNCQSGASAREFISDAVVDVVLTTGEAVATSAIAAGLSAIVILGIAGFTGGSVVPGIGNVVGLAAGIIIGIGTAYLVDNDLTGDGKSLRDNIKDFVFGLIDGENNDEKE